MFRNLTMTGRLTPAPQVITSTINESISGADLPCVVRDPCRNYLLNVHNTGTIDATLTWSDADTWLWLRLTRTDGTDIAEASSPLVNGLRQQLTVNVQGGQTYVLNVRWISGARITPFSLTATRPN
jgi:hypothetical protein